MIIRIIGWKILGEGEGREKRYIFIVIILLKSVAYTNTLGNFYITYLFSHSRSLKYSVQNVFLSFKDSLSLITRQSIGHKNYISLLPFNLTFTQRLVFNWFQK